jgi:hypothetical protein
VSGVASTPLSSSTTPRSPTIALKRKAALFEISGADLDPVVGESLHRSVRTVSVPRAADRVGLDSRPMPLMSIGNLVAGKQCEAEVRDEPSAGRQDHAVRKAQLAVQMSD